MWPLLGTWGGPRGVWPGPTDEHLEDVLSQVIAIVTSIGNARSHPDVVDDDVGQLVLDFFQGKVM